jgi:hypothetical protein
MKVLRNVLGLSALTGALGAGNAYGGEFDAFVKEAESQGYEVYEVSQGTRLWDAVEEILGTQADPCSPRALQTLVANANNTIANDSAKIADKVGLGVYASFLRSDWEGFTWTDCRDVRPTGKKDGIIGDSLDEYQVEKFPLAVDSKYVSKCREKVPEVLVQEGPKTEDNIPQAPIPEPKTEEGRYAERLRVGGQYIREGGEAPLGGFGMYLKNDTRFKMGNGALVFDLEGADINWLKYDAEQGKVLVGSVDFTGGYQWKASENVSLVGGLNVDGRSANSVYAGVNGVAGQFALGPEIGLEVLTENLRMDTRGRVGFGSVLTSVGILGYEATADSLTKTGLTFDLASKVAEPFWFGVRLDLERDSFNATTQDGALVPRSGTRTIAGGYGELDLTKRLGLEAGVYGVFNHGDYSNSADSGLFQLGLEYH